MYWMISTNANERAVDFFLLTEAAEKLNKYSTVSIDIRHLEMVNRVDVLIKWNTTLTQEQQQKLQPEKKNHRIQTE